MSIKQKVTGLLQSGFFRSFSVYVFATFLNQGVNFLLIPVFTFYLTPAEYGILSIINTAIIVFTILISVGSDSSVRKQYYVLDGNGFAGYFSSVLIINLYAFLFVFGVTLLLADWMSSILGVPEKWILIAPVVSLLGLGPLMLQGQNRVQKKAFAYAAFTNSFTVSNLALGILFVVVFKLGYGGRIMSLLLVNLAFCLIALYFLKRQKLFSRRITRENIRFALRYGLPVLPSLISIVVMANADRIFIARMVSMEEVGIYSIGYTIGNSIVLLVSAMSLGYTPFLFENLKAGKRQNLLKVVRVSWSFLAVLVLSVIILSLVSGFIYEYFVDPRYADGRRYVFWISMGCVFLGMYKLVEGILFYTNRTKFLGILGVVNILINLCLNYILINKYGTIGAAYATLISYFLMFVFTFVVSQRIIKLPWLNLGFPFFRQSGK